MTTTVLTVPPWLAGAEPAGVLWGKAVCRFYAITGKRRHVPVRTEVSATRTAVPGGADILDAAIRSALADFDNQVVVLSASLGSVIASRWLEDHGRRADRPDAARLRFVLLANPVRGVAHGAAPCDRFNAAPVQPTPTDTDYIVDDVARYGDQYAFPAGKPSVGAHSNYFRVSLPTLDRDKLDVERVGRTAYWVVP
ncbi:PE-PPE domain-containing protein [Mycobacterium sp. C3-094]